MAAGGGDVNDRSDTRTAADAPAAGATDTGRERTGRLSLSTLDAVPALLRPPIDPRQLTVGIVHLGIGAFHRAHQAAFTEDAIVAAGGDWGICGVTERSAAVVEQLAPQDGLYALARARAPTASACGSSASSASYASRGSTPVGYCAGSLTQRCT